LVFSDTFSPIKLIIDIFRQWKGEICHSIFVRCAWRIYLVNVEKAPVNIIPPSTHEIIHDACYGTGEISNNYEKIIDPFSQFMKFIIKS
jgi:hypothetical protein